MTDIDLNAIRGRVDALPSYGQWTVKDDVWHYVVTPEQTIVNEWGDWIDEPTRKVFAEFVSNAPTDIAALLAEVARLTEERDSARARTRGAVADYEEQTRRADNAEEALAERTEERAELETEMEVLRLEKSALVAAGLKHKRNAIAAREERDGLAAVIQRTEHILTRSLGRQAFRVMDEAVLALREAPTATLAARDAEKWDVGRAFGELPYKEKRPCVCPTPQHHDRNPYRTPQQGEQG
jgi:hypothetical protein